MSLQDFLPTPKFDEYSEFFKDFFTMSRRDDGVLLVQAHTAEGRYSSACRTTGPSGRCSRSSAPTPRTRS
jgi:hypothetical protein